MNKYINKTLIKEDRNKTKYYQVECTCRKCGGSGFLSCFTHVDGGVCFACGGRGIEVYEEKEYTAEYKAKMEERLNKKDQKKKNDVAAKWNLSFMKSAGFNESGKTYIIDAENTYEIKDELKSLGCRYNSDLGWFSLKPIETYPVIEVNIDQCYKVDEKTGKYFAYNKIKNFKANIKK